MTQREERRNEVGKVKEKNKSKGNMEKTKMELKENGIVLRITNRSIRHANKADSNSGEEGQNRAGLNHSSSI